MKIDVVFADYSNKKHAVDLASLLGHYAKDPMGGGQALSEKVKNNLAVELAKRPYAFSVICYVNDKPAGLINCFESFSTFKCKPLINIHDIVVIKEFRGLNLSQIMLVKVEEKAIEKGCCKLTLEVLEGNDIARHAYIKFGFDGYELDPKMGKALFWQKEL